MTVSNQREHKEVIAQLRQEKPCVAVFLLVRQ